MNEKKYNELISKLNSLIHDDGESPSVSPTTSSGVGQAPNPDTFYLRGDTDIDLLTENELLFAHVLLHKFYSVGCKTLTKEEIRELHKVIRKKMNHSNFDRLDYDG